jgi:hypothetical protein
VKHKLEITLTEKQADLLYALIDSYEEAAEQLTIKNGYRDVNKFALVLKDKLYKAQSIVTQRKETDAKLSAMLSKLRGKKK